MTTNTGTNGVAADAPMDLPVISLGAYLADPASAEGLAQCVAAASALITYGALVVHDPRVPAGANDEFLDLLEDYFAQPQEVLERDTRPELAYQVGATLENTERPKCAVDEDCLDVIARLAESERPLDISGHQPDPKCRFFWRMGETPPYETAFPALNAENVVPSNPKIAERWTTVLERWGNTMKTAVADVAEMAAVGMGLPAMTFKDAGCYG